MHCPQQYLDLGNESRPNDDERNDPASRRRLDARLFHVPSPSISVAMSLFLRGTYWCALSRENIVEKSSRKELRQRRYSYAVVFAILAITLLVAAFRIDDILIRILLIWSSLSLARLSVAYFRRNAAVFGKGADGSLAPLAVVVMLPFLLLTWGVWYLQNLVVRLPACNQITPTLFLGRRCGPSALPPSTMAIIDVTAEFPTPRRLRKEFQVIAIPILDGCAPTWEECLRIHEHLQALGNPVAFVHCANGHGRSVTVMAVLLGLFDMTKSADEALKIIRISRSAIGPNADQRAFLDAAFRKLGNRPEGAS